MRVSACRLYLKGSNKAPSNLTNGHLIRSAFKSRLPVIHALLQTITRKNTVLGANNRENPKQRSEQLELMVGIWRTLVER